MARKFFILVEGAVHAFAQLDRKKAVISHHLEVPFRQLNYSVCLNATRQGRRLCRPSITVNWFTASQRSSTHRRNLSDGRFPIAQQIVKRPVRLHQRRRRHAQHFAQRLLPRFLGNAGIQPPQSLAQPPHQHHLAKRIALPPARPVPTAARVRGRSPAPRTTSGRCLRRWIW